MGEHMKRPIGVTAIALIDFLASGAALVAGTVFLKYLADAATASVLFVAAATLSVLGIGLWKMKNWARLSTVILAAFSLLADIFLRISLPSLNGFSYQQIVPESIGRGIELWSVIYFLTPTVSRAFRSPTEHVTGTVEP